MAKVLLESISKRFPDGTLAVNEVSLRVLDREFLVLVGPSGCGKSTTLRLIAGLETNTSGVVKIGDRDVTNVPPRDRDVAMVFQNYALYPHMSVYRNMSFGLMLRHFGGLLGDGVIGRGLRKLFQPHRASADRQLLDEIDAKVRQTADRLSISHLLDRKPHQLSGGERQRVALGRAIVRNPAAFLFDEPLSNLDAKLRQQLRVELKRLHRELAATMIYVTHDQIEAMTLGDRVAVMNQGEVQQIGTPTEIYRQPANLFVAKFIGSLPMNFCHGELCRDGNAIRFDGGFSREWSLTTERCESFDWLKAKSSRPVVLGVRPEDLRLVETGDLQVKIAEIEWVGESTTLHGRLSDHEGNEQTKPSAKHSSEFVARVEADTNLEVGQVVGLSVDINRLLWFDPESGQNLMKERK